MQEKNNTDHNSFYTPQLLSDMLTQALADDLDDSGVPIGREVGSAHTGPDKGLENRAALKILVTVASNPNWKPYSEIHYSVPSLLGSADILSQCLDDFGKIVVFEHQSRRPKLKKSDGIPVLHVFCFNMFHLGLADYIRQQKMLITSLSESLQEIYGNMS